MNELDVQLDRLFCQSRRIAFLGPDGSGKTLLADLITQTLALQGIEVQRHHWRPEVFPSPRIIFGQTIKAQTDTPHGKQRHNLLISWLLLWYYWLDFALYEWAQVINSSRNKCIIWERWFIDVAKDPLRHRLRGICKLSQFLCKLLPQPDIFIVLVGSTEVFYKRKGEILQTEMARQIEKLKRALEKNPRAIFIDSSAMSQEDSIKAVLAFLLEAIP